MLFSQTKTIERSAHYKIELIKSDSVLLFDWMHIKGLSARDFAAGIAQFAHHCVDQKPKRAVIDATKLDFESPAVAWLRGHTEEGEEAYDTWWVSEIVPLYNEAGIETLTVATGDPNAPGELKELPPIVNFRIAYLADLKTALSWPNF